MKWLCDSGCSFSSAILCFFSLSLFQGELIVVQRFNICTWKLFACYTSGFHHIYAVADFTCFVCCSFTDADMVPVVQLYWGTFRQINTKIANWNLSEFIIMTYQISLMNLALTLFDDCDVIKHHCSNNRHVSLLYISLFELTSAVRRFTKFCSAAHQLYVLLRPVIISFAVKYCTRRISHFQRMYKSDCRPTLSW